MTFEALIAQLTNVPENPLDKIYLKHADNLSVLANAEENHHLFFIRIKRWHSSFKNVNIYQSPSHTGMETGLIRELYKPFLMFYNDLCKVGGRDAADVTDRPPCYAYVNASPMYKARFFLDIWIVVKGDEQAAFIKSDEGMQAIRSQFSGNIDLSVTRYSPKEPGHYHFQSTRLYRVFPDKFKRPLITGFDG